MPGGRSYSSTTSKTTLTVDPGASGASLTVADSTVFGSLDGKFPWTALINWGLADQEIVTVTARPDGTHLTVTRGEDGSIGQAHASGATVEHGISARDFGNDSTPQVWYAFGHSYLQFISGTTFTTGRLDAQFRMMMDVEFTNWRNFGTGGAKLTQDGRAQGGWVRVMQDITHYQIAGQNVHGAPYWADGGAYLMVYGINDIGGITTSQANIRAAYQHALRAVLARMRTSVVWEDNYVPVSGTAGQPSYGTGWTTVTSGTSDKSSGTTLHTATSTTSATITLTLPADYAGETVVIQFVANAGAVGGTVTFSGTAGVTGTLTTSNIIPSGVGTNAVPVVRRITSLTAANAGQTIIMTLTSLDAGGSMQFDYWGLESKNPNPIIVANCARLPAAGYTGNGYPNVFGDADVTALNTAMASVIAEFDGGLGMVELADIDSALNKDTTRFGSDQLHPNEFGAGRAANACINAVRTLVPVDSKYPAASMTPSASVSAGYRRPRFQNQYYSTEWLGATSTAALTAQEVYAIPWVVTESREIWTRVAVEQAVAGTVSAQVRIGLYDDPTFSGYPQCLYNEATSGGAWSPGITTGIREFSGIYWWPDPGLWWLVIKVISGGTGPTFTTISGPDGFGVMPKIGTTVGAGSSITRNTTPIAWKLISQGTGALASTFPAGATVNGTAPLVAMFKG